MRGKGRRRGFRKGQQGSRQNSQGQPSIPDGGPTSGVPSLMTIHAFGGQSQDNIGQRDGESEEYLDSVADGDNLPPPTGPSGLLPTPKGLLPRPGDKNQKGALLPSPGDAPAGGGLLPPPRNLEVPPGPHEIVPVDENSRLDVEKRHLPPAAAKHPPVMKPFKPIGLTPHGQRILAQKETKDPPHAPPFRNEPPRNLFEVKNDQDEDGEISEQSTDEFVPDFVKCSLVTEISEENKKLPLFLLCPLCRDLLLDPLVLPCFHAICGTKCIPKLTQDGYNVWCPQCKKLQKTKYGIDALQPAETFGKMSRQLREQMREEACESGEISEDMDSDVTRKQVLTQPSPVDDLTCRVCDKIFSLPLRLPCSHSICKFPCAYKTLDHNFQIVCPVCERPTYINGGINSLPVSEDLVSQIKAIKGENYLEDCESKWQELDNMNNEQFFDDNMSENLMNGEIQHLLPDDELNMMRLKNLEKAEQKKQAIPSLLSLNLPPPPSFPKLPAPKRQNQDDQYEFEEEDEPNQYPLPPVMKEPEEVKPLPYIPDEELLYSEEPIAATIMGISWDGPKRCRAPLDSGRGTYQRHGMGRRDKTVNGGRFDGRQQQGYKNNRRQQDNRNKPAVPKVSYEGGMIVKDHNHQSTIPSLLDGLSFSPPRDDFQGPSRRGGGGYGAGSPNEYDQNEHMDDGLYESQEIPGQEMVMHHPENIIAPMLANTGSGPPPIVNYQSPAVVPESEVINQQPSVPASMPVVTALPPGIQAPTSLPVMDPSTIPTMNSAFEYQAHWTKFVQQTMAYYNSIYAAQGGTPPEAQQMINDYLSKCWAWYSAFTNLCQVNPEYKDITNTEKKPKENKGETEPETKAEARKRKKKNKKAMKQISTNPAAPDVDDMDPKEIEELKIMLLKKQLELKVKHARNKSELRDLMNMKKLVLEEEGDAEEKVEEISEEEREKVKEAAKQKQLEREKEIERQEKEREKDRDREILRLQEEREREREREKERERERELRERERQRRKDRRRDKDRERDRYDRDRRYKRDRRDDFRERRRGRSRTRSRSRSHSSGGRTPPRKSIPKEKEESKDEEPKYIKVANLPDEVKAVDLKGFVENFGQVLNCKIGKMQGEMIAVVYMASLADAMSCVRDMHGSHFKGKILEVKYMGTKPHLKQVEVSIPDVYSGPSQKMDGPGYSQKTIAGPSYGYDGPDYYNSSQDIRTIWIGNVPWGTTEDEMMRFVSHHGRVFDCRIGTNSDPNQRGLYAIVTLESYIDVLKCINSLHGIRFEGRTLDVKKMKY